MAGNAKGNKSSYIKLKQTLFGAPRDLADRSLFHRIALIPILAWIGLGADGLSSSSYGPEEAFRTLGDHTYLGVALAVLIGATVMIIAAGYSRIIEHFPHGGGGYIVATNLLGKSTGVVSGSALLVDYMLTIAVSIASAGDTIFSFLPIEWLPWKFSVEVVLIAFLVLLNLRGVRESVLALTPIFIVFAVTHIILIGGYFAMNAPHLPETAVKLSTGYHQGLMTLGWGGMLLLLLHAYSFGAGTYTGLEAVSNGLPVMREPKVYTAKKTMLYMAISLTLTAGGLILAYLLGDIRFSAGKTMNASLVEQFASGYPLGGVFIALTLLSEGALLVVAAQTGFIDGPRVLSNMAMDYWMPRRFASLSDRLTTKDGVLTMGACALAALFYTNGDIRQLVVMYSINVFITFSLSMFGMLRFWWGARRKEQQWKGKVLLFSLGFVLCATILVMTILMKFREGGWLTLVITGSVVALCFAINKHYRSIGKLLHRLFADLMKMDFYRQAQVEKINPTQPTAAVLVSGFSGLGIHTVINIFHHFPNQFRNLVFISVGALDSAALREENPVEALRARTETSLQKYTALAKQIGLPSTYLSAIGTDVIEETEKLCLQAAEQFPNITFFAGQLAFRDISWFHRILHNDTALAIQKRLQLAGKMLVIIPAKV